MFPWVYGFTWDAGSIVFLGAFFTVLAVLVATLMKATLRAVNDVKLERTECIRWKSDFHDLPAAAKKCRHEFTGEFAHRTCDNNFDCRDCATHAKLMSEHPLVVPENAEDVVYGFTMPLDRMYHRGHTWVRREEDGSFTIGLDDFASRLIGVPEQIELPPAGTRLRVNGTAWNVKKQGAAVRILSPVEGEVIEAGDPQRGWFLRVKPLEEKPNLRNLLRGAEIRPWMLREMERFQGLLATEGAGIALADGGVPVNDFSKAYPRADWDTVMGEMLLEP